MSVTIIIPTKNEEKTIGQVIDQCFNYERNIIVVDGHSSDQTREIAQNKGVKVLLDNGKSKGDALRVGAMACDSDIIVFMDADGSHDPKDIPELIKPIIENDYDLVIASRAKGGSDELHGSWDNFIRNTGSNMIALLINWRYKNELTDIMNGFRAIKRQAFLDLNTQRNDFVIEQEMIVSACKKGYKITEIASHEYARQGGTSKLPTGQGWRFIWHIIKSML